MAQSRAGGRLDWGLFLIVVVASLGFSAFLPGEPLDTSLILSSAIMAVLVIREPVRAFAVVLSNPLVFFIAAWSLVAALLSPRQGLALVFTGALILMIVYTSVRESTADGTLRVFAMATATSLVPSIVGQVVPLFGVPVLQHAGSAGGYAGYFPWNSAAGLCAAAALLSATLVFLRTGFMWWQLPAAAAALFMLATTESATAQLALAAGGAVLGGQALFRRVRSAHSRIFVLVGVGVSAVIFAPRVFSYISGAAVADVADRTTTFSGRTAIWQFALDGMKESVFFGYGTEFWKMHGGWNNSGHNGFLDVALSSGVPAALALCAILVVAAARLARVWSPLLPLFAFGVVVNLAISQIAVPTVASLAVWLAVGATLRTGAARAPNEVTAAAADGPHSADRRERVAGVKVAGYRSAT